MDDARRAAREAVARQTRERRGLAGAEGEEAASFHPYAGSVTFTMPRKKSLPQRLTHTPDGRRINWLPASSAKAEGFPIPNKRRPGSIPRRDSSAHD